jgi:peptidoglycan/LPS O-acetylase OafA/YrhL
MARTGVLTLALATASWWLVERPAIGWAAARSGRRRDAPGAPKAGAQPHATSRPAYAER